LRLFRCRGMVEVKERLEAAFWPCVTRTCAALRQVSARRAPALRPPGFGKDVHRPGRRREMGARFSPYRWLDLGHVRRSDERNVHELFETVDVAPPASLSRRDRCSGQKRSHLRNNAARHGEPAPSRVGRRPEPQRGSTCWGRPNHPWDIDVGSASAWAASTDAPRPSARRRGASGCVPLSPAVSTGGQRRLGRLARRTTDTRGPTWRTSAKTRQSAPCSTRPVRYARMIGMEDLEQACRLKPSIGPCSRRQERGPVPNEDGHYDELLNISAQTPPRMTDVPSTPGASSRAEA